MDTLLKTGKKIRVLVRSSSNLRWIPDDRVETVVADMRDEASLVRLVAGISEVYHFGGLTRARTPEIFHDVNAHGTIKLAEAFLNQAPVGGRFLFCSSLAAAGPAPNAAAPCLETDSPQPITPYGKSKLAAETGLNQLFAATTGKEAQLIIIRPPAVYGPRDDAILSFFRFIAHGWLPLPSPPHSLISLLHVQDLVHGCLCLAEAGTSGTYYLDDGRFHRWEELGAAISSALSKNPRAIRVPPSLVKLIGSGGDLFGKMTGQIPVINRDKAFDILQPFWICNSTKARNLGYHSSVSIEEGMKETARWYLEHKWI